MTIGDLRSLRHPQSLEHEMRNPTTDTPTYAQGAACARREIKIDGWTPWMAQRYLDECAAISRVLAAEREDFDRGYMDAMREHAAKATT